MKVCRLHLQIAEVSITRSLRLRKKVRHRTTNKKIWSANKNNRMTPSFNKLSSLLPGYRPLIKGKAQLWLRLLASRMTSLQMSFKITLPRRRFFLRLLSVRKSPIRRGMTLQVKICSSQGISRSSRGWLMTSIRRWRLNSSARRTGALSRSSRFLKGSV